MKFKTKLAIALVCGGLSIQTFAMETVAKEETTPPPAEGALTIDQLQPINSSGKAAAVATPATNATTTTTTTTIVAPKQ